MMRRYAFPSASAPSALAPQPTRSLRMPGVARIARDATNRYDAASLDSRRGAVLRAGQDDERPCPVHRHMRQCRIGIPAGVQLRVIPVRIGADLLPHDLARRCVRSVLGEQPL